MTFCFAPHFQNSTLFNSISSTVLPPSTKHHLFGVSSSTHTEHPRSSYLCWLLKYINISFNRHDLLKRLCKVNCAALGKIKPLHHRRIIFIFWLNCTVSIIYLRCLNIKKVFLFFRQTAQLHLHSLNIHMSLMTLHYPPSCKLESF